MSQKARKGQKTSDGTFSVCRDISTKIDGSFFPWCDILACNQKIQTAAQRGIECLGLSSSLAFWLEPITCKYARRLVFCRFAAHGSIFSRSRSPLARSRLRLPPWPLGRFLLWCAGGAAARIGPFMMLACGLVSLFYAVRVEDLAGLVNGNKTMMGVPVALSFDNLLAGAVISSLHYPVVAAALLIGLVSAAMSCIGLYLGAWIRRFADRKMEFAVGAYLCLLAGRALLMGGA